MEAHEEGELGEVDPKEPHPLQKAEAVGRLWGEEEPRKLLLDPFPRGEGLGVGLEEPGVAGKGLPGPLGKPEAQGGGEAHPPEASQVVLVEVFLPHGDEEAPPQVLLHPREAEDGALPPEEGV